MKISVSFITSLYKEKETVSKLALTNADYIHLDIMDGKFVKNKNYTFSEILKIINHNPNKLDVHLMVENPHKYLEDYASLNTEYLTFHYEAVKKPEELIEQIKNYGLKVGISIKPKTAIKKIIPLLSKIDQVLIMSVEPGKGGQEFIPEVIAKIQELVEVRKKNDYSFIISVDGGVNDTNISILRANEVDQVVVGSYVCMKENFQQQIDNLR